MAFFDWEEAFSVGIREIDQQHRKLVDMLNDLYEALKKGEGRETLGKVLSDLVSYTKTHFATEERLMKLHGYPDFPTHKEKHEKITEMVLQYVEKYQSGEMKSPIEIGNFLKDWLKKHILQTDMAYSPFLIGKGAQ